MRYFLLDRIESLEIGKRARAVKCITYSDETLHDHFPDFPVMPGALLVEAGAQLASFLFEMTINKEGPSPRRRSLLVGIDKARFHSFAEPGDRILLTAELIKPSTSSAQAKVLLEVEGERIANMTLTLVSRPIESQAVHDQREKLYQVWMRNLKEGE